MVPGKQDITVQLETQSAAVREDQTHGSIRHADTWKHWTDTQIEDKMAHLVSKRNQRRSTPEANTALPSMLVVLTVLVL